MELTVKLGNAELSNAPESAICGFVKSVKELAGYGGEPVKEVPEVKESSPAPKPEKKTKTKAAEKAPEPEKVEESTPEPEKVEEPKAEPEKVEAPAPEPVEEKKEEAPAGPDRAEVRKRLAEIRNEDETKAPKILEILHKFGVKKFSELPDEHLADVLAKAEAL